MNVWCEYCGSPALVKSWRKPDRTLRGVQADVSAWADSVFPDRTVGKVLAKLMCEELPELIASKLKDPLEYADVLLMVLDLAYLMKIDVQKALEDKMEINRARTWSVDPDTGFYKHKRGESE